MHAAAIHLARRGLEISKNASGNEDYNMPVWGVVLLVITVGLFFILDASVEYTFKRLIPTLIMVESPQAVLFDPIDVDAPLIDKKQAADMDSKTPPTEAELLLVKIPPITRTFRSTLRHLRSQAGCLSRYRGFGAFLGYITCLRLVAHPLMAIGVPFVFTPIIASLICANLAMTWTHVAISKPSEKPWFKRIPSVTSWKKVAGPTVFLAVAKEMTCLVPLYLAAWYGMLEMKPHEVNAMSKDAKHLLFWQGISVAGVALIMVVLFVIPANVALTRIQASLLADEVETIVHFDRSFGGKVVPEIVGGTGVVTARDAWKTFELSSRMTLFKSYGKAMVMQVFLFMVFCIAIGSELVLILGDDIKKYIPEDQQSLFGAK